MAANTEDATLASESFGQHVEHVVEASHDDTSVIPRAKIADRGFYLPLFMRSWCDTSSLAQ